MRSEASLSRRGSQAGKEGERRVSVCFREDVYDRLIARESIFANYKIPIELCGLLVIEIFANSLNFLENVLCKHAQLRLCALVCVYTCIQEREEFT